ncbi:MAG: sugar ABC transporter ATP-binding protein [Anaerolineae bacterium]|nr:sugar ABC transporter ATP-binding protein [Anaerolineae bacterium]MDW8172373.1 sugar ABC transporter ATP-binding protein [Anaerolineae bacterium]
MSEEILRVQGISKSFAGVQALNHVDLTINRGEIACLVGENGSGKSTFIKIICGVYTPDEGEIFLNGRRYKQLRPIDSIHEGVQVIFQDFSLFPNLTVAENIALNQQVAQGRRFVNWREVNAIARQALERINVSIPLDVTVSELSVANKQLVAISRAMLQNARLIIMDEPTTALTHREVEALYKVVRGLQAQGISVLFVSHKLNEVQALAERVIIFRNGMKVIDTPAQEMTQEKIAYYMTGHDIAESRYEYQAKDAPIALEVSNLSRKGAFSDVSFRLRAGEIVGVTGLLGSGRTELALALFGAQPAESGTISLGGQTVSIRSIQDAVRHGIGYVPEDRLTEGLFLEQSIANNIVVRIMKSFAGRGGLIDSVRKAAEASNWVQHLSIKTRNPQLPVKSLSGGNQQRVVIAKWLASLPRVLILNGPTVGVDVGSKEEIHTIIKELAQQGLAILVISDDIPELFQICNRILLMQRGRLVNEFETQAIDEATLADHLLETVNQGQ